MLLAIELGIGKGESKASRSIFPLPPVELVLGRMSDLSDFEHLWSEPGWIVLRHTEDREHLVIVFEKGATINDLMALRALLPELAATPVSSLSSLKGARQFDLGEHESAAARRLKSLCESRQLLVSSKGRQFIHHGLFNEQTRLYCLIEDDELREAAAAEAIRRGVPVRRSIV